VKPGGIVTTMSGQYRRKIAAQHGCGRPAHPLRALTSRADIKPATVLDIATLTGGLRHRLDRSERHLSRRTTGWRRSSSPPARAPMTGAWRMPLTEDYAEPLKSISRTSQRRRARGRCRGGRRIPRKFTQI